MNVGDVVTYDTRSKDDSATTAIGTVTDSYPNDYYKITPKNGFGPVFRSGSEMKLLKEEQVNEIPTYCDGCTIDDKIGCNNHGYCEDLAKEYLEYLCKGCEGPKEIIKKEAIESFMKICGKKKLPDKYGSCPNEQFCVLLNEHEKSLNIKIS